MTEYYVGCKVRLKIRFENKSDATAPAHIIRVTDTLDEDLDLDTFELTEIGFAGETIAVPGGLNSYKTAIDLTVENEYVDGSDVRVEIDVSLDSALRHSADV